MAVTQFGAPIPGQSLATSKPGERRWERPPEAASVEDALRFYMERLSDEEVIDDFMVAIESGIAIVPLVETLYLSSVMNGIHSLDVGIIVAPALSEYFAAVARSYDIDYKLSKKDYKKEQSEKEKAKLVMLLQSAISEVDTPDEGTAMLSDMASYLEGEKPQEETPELEELQQVAEPMEEPMEEITAEPMPSEGAGLMARGV